MAEGSGTGIHISEGQFQTVLGLIGDTGRIDMDLIASLGIVDSVKRVTEPFKCCNRKFHPDDMVVNVGDVKVGGGNFCMIAGPCSVENEEQILAVARRGKGQRREYAARRRVQAAYLALRVSGPKIRGAGAFEAGPQGNRGCPS